MKTWQIGAPRTMELNEGIENTDGESAKIKFTRCGVTTADIRAYTGEAGRSYPFTPCRLGAGVISELSKDTENSMFARGKRVVIDPYFACGACFECQSGDGCDNMLTAGVDRDGFLRDFAVIPLDNLHLLPDHVKDDEAIFTDLIATALAAIDRLQLEKGEHLAILGASEIGIILAQLAIYYQAVPILIDARQDMLDIAREFGVYYTVNTSEVEASKKIINITGGKCCEAVAYMAGSADKPQKALDFTCNNGRIAFVGAYDYDALAINIKDIVDKSLQLSGVKNGRGFTLRAINMLANKAVQVQSFITNKSDFASVGSAFEEIAAHPMSSIFLSIKV